MRFSRSLVSKPHRCGCWYVRIREHIRLFAPYGREEGLVRMGREVERT